MLILYTNNDNNNQVCDYLLSYQLIHQVTLLWLLADWAGGGYKGVAIIHHLNVMTAILSQIVGASHCQTIFKSINCMDTKLR